jgi:DNA-directed RNA polymerase specialized sigma24 family protein
VPKFECFFDFSFQSQSKVVSDIVPNLILNKQHIIDCLKTLNSRTQDAIFMQYFHHKTYAQIAKSFNKSDNTIKSWV